MSKLEKRNVADVNGSLISAVSEGKSANLQDLIRSHGLSYCEAAYGSYALLRDAIKSGQFDTAELLLQQGTKVDFETDKVSTPLHYAVEKGCVELVDLLLERNAPVDARNKENKTPLHLAVERGHASIVKVLLDSNASLMAQTNIGSTPLFLAIEGMHEEIVGMLLQYACANAKGENNSTLGAPADSTLLDRILVSSPSIHDEVNKLIEHIVIEWHSHCKIVDDLIHHGFVFSGEYVDKPLLNAAIQKNYFKLIENILLNSVNVINERFNPFILKTACEKERKEIVTLIINSGFDINAKDERGEVHFCHVLRCMDEMDCVEFTQQLLARGVIEGTAPGLLHTAVEGGLSEVCKVLIENGADVNARSRYRETPLLLAVPNKGDWFWQKSKRSINESISDKIIGLLLNSHANVILGPLLNSCIDVSTRTRDRLTSFHRAVKNGRKETVCIFLDFGIDVNLQADDGSTPLHLASSAGHDDIVKILIARQANVDACDHKNETPLHLAAKNGHPQVVARLCKEGANIEARQRRGWMPLHSAAFGQHAAVVETLLGVGVDVNARGSKNETALHCSAMVNPEIHCPRVMYVLLVNGCDINAETKEGEIALDILIRKVKAYDYDGSDEDSDFGSDFDPNLYNVVTVVKRFLVALIVAGLYVSERNLNLLGNTCLYDFPSTDPIEISDVEEECEEEVNRMKEIKLNPQISLYDMLKNSNNLTYAKNKLLMESLLSFDLKEFRIYGTLVKGNFKKNILRLELMGSGQKSLDLLVKVSTKLNGTKTLILPEELLELIVSYLDSQEIKCLISCGETLRQQLRPLV